MIEEKIKRKHEKLIALSGKHGQNTQIYFQNNQNKWWKTGEIEKIVGEWNVRQMWRSPELNLLPNVLKWSKYFQAANLILNIIAMI